MSEVVSFTSQRACLAFSDYLTTLNIPHQVQQSEQHLIVVTSTEYSEFVYNEYQQFLSNPADDKYLAASWQTNYTVKSKQGLGLKKIWLASGPLTKLVTLVCVLIYLACIAGYYRVIFNALHFDISLSEPYRLLTPAIMHLSTLHIVFNLTWWWYLGNKVELKLGWGKLLTIFIVTALFSNTLQALLVSYNFAGLSGVTFGLAGFVWLYGVRFNDPRIFLPNNIFVFLLIWMALGFAEVLPVNMANWAHLVGMLTGMALVYLMPLKKAH